ncbi:MAG TPA: alpha-L-fucosidase [Chitinophagaceae bacterium]|nr:alpha-L-fucosidase [Chitinophagaceae bacterium]
MKIFITFFLIISFEAAAAQFIKKIEPKPSKAQLAWHDMEFYLFTHFGPNTFTDLEWGKGNEKEEVFNPAQLDCDQWCRVAKAAGAKGIIITAKHHDGFCLWPSKYSRHTVRESKWKNGKGDVLKELSASCKKYNLKFGVYLSPWDRNHPVYGTAKYNDVFANMLKEIFTNYGPIWELWWDGANGEGPNGKKQIYDFTRFENLIRSISPNTIIFSDIGPDIRWVGNESGIAGKTNWNTLDTAGFMRGSGAPPTDTLNTGNIYGKNWIPAECDVSIRPGWFYHKKEDTLVKSPQQLFKLYLESVGRGACLLLNVPPDGRGLITEYDSVALVDFKKIRDESFEKNLTKKGDGYFVSPKGMGLTKKLNDSEAATFESVSNPHLQSMGIEFKKTTKINCVVLKESLIKGQFCMKFRLTLKNGKHQLIKEINGTTIGHKRILTFPATEVNSIGLSIDEQKGITSISEIEAYLIDENLIAN